LSSFRLSYVSFFPFLESHVGPYDQPDSRIRDSYSGMQSTVEYDNQVRTSILELWLTPSYAINEGTLSKSLDCTVYDNMCNTL